MSKFALFYFFEFLNVLCKTYSTGFSKPLTDLFVLYPLAWLFLLAQVQQPADEFDFLEIYTERC